MNSYEASSIKTHIIWVVITTIANHIPIEGVIGKCIRSYLAMVLWLLLILNNKENLIRKGAILLIYLKFNPVANIIENISYSILVVKIGMLCVTLEQIIYDRTVEIIRIMILLHFAMVAMYLPDSKEI